MELAGCFGSIHLNPPFYQDAQHYFDGDKDALKSFQSKLKGEQTREKGNMEGGEREEGGKGMEARLACLLVKLTQMTDASEFSRLI